MVDFNAPIMEDESEAGGNGHSAAPDPIDINDPLLVSESLEGLVDDTKDAYEIPPPPPDKVWLAKLRLRQVKSDDGTDALVDYKAGKSRDGSQKYLQTAIEAEIVDTTGVHDGRKIYDYFVSTMIRRDKSTGVGTILRHAKVAVKSNKDGVLTHACYMQALVQWLKSEPKLKIQTAWEASWDIAIEAARKAGEPTPKGSTVTGMHNFQVVRGQPSPEYKWPDRSVTRARARITRYLPL